MGIIITGESEIGKELARWNTPRNQVVPGTNGEFGKKNVGYERYPAMLYLARQQRNGQYAVTVPMPSPADYQTDLNGQQYLRAEQQALAFNESCQRTVRNDTEFEQAVREGWRKTPGEAMDFRKSLEDAVSTAAAERAYQDRRMSPAAQAEMAAAEADTHEHVLDVPAPKRTRGRPRKVEAA